MYDAERRAPEIDAAIGIGAGHLSRPEHRRDAGEAQQSRPGTRDSTQFVMEEMACADKGISITLTRNSFSLYAALA